MGGSVIGVFDLKAKIATRWRKIYGQRNEWPAIIKRDQDLWTNLLDKAKGGTKVLIATSTGGHKAVTPVESLLAAALTIRGAEVHFLLCNEFLPACLQASSENFPNIQDFIDKGPKSLCQSCYKKGRESYDSFGLQTHSYSDLVTVEESAKAEELAKSLDTEGMRNYRYEGLAVGEHALAGALRYFARGDLNGIPGAKEVLARYFKASLLTSFAVDRLLSTHKFTTSVFHHGIYVPQGIIGEVARKRGVNVVNWNPAYRKKCFIFSHKTTYHHTLMAEDTSSWEEIAWSPKTEAKLMDYLKSRWQGTQDWIWFHEKPAFEIEKIAKDMGIDFNKPCVGLLTNVMWDAQLHYPANAFPNMLEWVLQSMRYFEKRPELQLIIRIHPAEIRGTTPSKQPLAAEIKKAFPALPKNIFVIGPESPVSTYAVMEKCNAALIYGTKMGVELTSVGLPVIVAGEAWVRNKGITYDAKDAKHYFDLLDKLPFSEKTDNAKIVHARKYAYHFFFRRMIPVQSIQPNIGWPPYRIGIQKLDSLFEGRDKGLDVICDGILKGKEFIYKDELR